MLSFFNKTPAIRKVLCTPFYFNALFQVLTKRGDIDLEFPENAVKLKDHLEKEYVQRKLKTKNSKYTADEILQYLKWLAIWLNQQKQLNFELADFQPDTLRKPKVYRLIYSLVNGLLVGLTLSLVYGLFSGLFSALLFSLIAAVAEEGIIETEEIRTWQWTKLYKFKTWLDIVMDFLGYVLIGGFTLGLICGLIGVLVLSLSEAFTIGLFLGLFVSLV